MNKPTDKSRKSNVAPIKTDPPAVDPKPSLVELVQKALDDYADWVGDTERGVMTPVQFLAVVLWVLSNEKTSAADEKLIVDGWGAALLEAARLQVVVALHPITFLSLHGDQDPRKWVLSVNHADYFLDQMPVGFCCSKVLTHWREQAAEQSDGVIGELTYDQAKARRKKAGKGSAWTGPQRDAVAREIARRKDETSLFKTISADFGISQQALRSAFPGGKQGRGPGKTNSVALTSHVWPTARTGGT